ncbi:hypothetical protein BGZ46_010553 [Entomortierella lignicola]|nr:hypothetical protein BGZ46_010553 [Entomortierella lignicola]
MNTVSEWIESCATYDGTPFVSQTRQQQQQQQHSMRHGLQDQAQHLQQLTQHQLQELAQHQLQLQQHHHHQQQLVHAYNCSSSMTSIQHEVNNDMLIAMSLASSTNSPTVTGMSNCDSIDNDTFPMPSLGFPRSGISIDYNDPSASASDSDSNAAALWAQLVMATNDIDGNLNSYSPFLSLPMLPFPGSGLSPTEQDQEILTPTIVPSQQPSSPSPVAAPTTTSYPPTPILASHASFAASVDKMAMNPMGAHEQFTAVLYSWSQLNHPVNNVMDQFGNVASNSLAHYPSSSLTSSPALSTTSSFTACSGYTASPSPSPSVYSPSLLSASFFETNNNGDNNSNSNNSNHINTNPSNTITTTTTHNFVPRSTSKLTRRLSQTVQLKTSLSSLSSSSSSSSSSPSSPSSSPSLKSGSVFGNRQASSHSPLWLSTSVSRLTCPICKGRYANNSTLRRHQRIHDLELNQAKQLALDRSLLGSGGGGEGTVTAKTEKVDNVGNTSTLLEDTESLAHRRSLCSGVSLLSLSDIKQQGIDPAHEDLPDPNLRKPECVGCKKAFARRDTVILHIKNQKRKWDLLNAILQSLTAVNCDALQVDAMQSISITSTAAAVVALSVPGENAIGAGAGASTSAGVVKNKKPQRQRRSHPYRMAEKLWHSTLQRHHISLTSNSSNNNRTTGGATSKGSQSPSIKKEAADEYRVKVEEDDDNDDDFNDDCDNFVRHCKLEDEGVSDEEVEDDEEKVDGDDNWPDMEEISKMDSQAKLQLMMRTMTLPPCWRVRKVRIFGEFGVLDQKVLQ